MHTIKSRTSFLNSLLCQWEKLWPGGLLRYCFPGCCGKTEGRKQGIHCSFRVAVSQWSAKSNASFGALPLISRCCRVWGSKWSCIFLHTISHIICCLQTKLACAWNLEFCKKAIKAWTSSPTSAENQCYCLICEEKTLLVAHAAWAAPCSQCPSSKLEDRWTQKTDWSC